MPVAKNANTSDPAGTATMSQRGWRSLRSIRTRVLSAGHEQADLLDVRVVAGRLARDRPLVHDDDAVGEQKDLVEVLADEEHSDPVGSGLTQIRVHGLDRADVEAARRRPRDDELRLAGELAREDDLLQVAAGQEARWSGRARRRDPVAMDQLDGALADLSQPQQRPARRVRLAV